MGPIAFLGQNTFKSGLGRRPGWSGWPASSPTSAGEARREWAAIGPPRRKGLLLHQLLVR